MPAPSPGQSASTSQEPEFRKQVDEVSIDLTVHNKKRKPILDLKPEDLAIADNGTPVKLTELHLVRGNSARGHLVTLVFDPFSGAVAREARVDAQKILKLFPEKEYEFAVLDLGGRLRLLQPFTTDRKLVDSAIAVETDSHPITLTTTLSLDVNITRDTADSKRSAFAGAAEKNLIAVARTGVDASGRNAGTIEKQRAQMLLSALQNAQKITQEQHTYRSLAGLQALVESQERAPERKALIYFTRNRQMDSSAQQMITKVAAAATRAGVTIYIVDLDAMNDAHSYEMSNAEGNAMPRFVPGKDKIGCGSGGCEYVQRLQQEYGEPIHGDPSTSGYVWKSKHDIMVMTDFQRQSGDYAMFAYKKNPMIALSEISGGLYLDPQNGFKKGLLQLSEELTTYYEATYTPPKHDSDGSYRTISISPVRKDLRVQSKAGYFAVAPGEEQGLRPFERPMLKLLDTNESPADVPFHATVLRFGEMTEGNTSTLAIAVPVKTLDFQRNEQDHLYSAHICLEARVRDSHGVEVERVGDDITSRGALESVDRDGTAAITLDRHFISAPGPYMLEVAVVDRMNGKVGVQRIPFEIPGPEKAGISDIVLVKKTDQIASDDQDSVEPLRYESSRITPNISGELAPGAKGLSLFLVLHPEAAAKGDPTLEMQVIHNGKAGRRIPLPLRSGLAGAALPYMASFGQNALAPGDYKVIAYLKQGDNLTEKQVQFHVGQNGLGNQPETEAGSVQATVASLDPSAGIVSGGAGQLAITPLDNPTAPLAPEAAKQLIEDARERALSYRDSLPNFMCVEVTNRSDDPGASGRWKLHDSLVEVLKYRDKQETRTTIELNGKRSTVDRQAMRGSLSAGEFGGVLQAIFSQPAQAEFKWKSTEALGTGTVQVFDYNVSPAHSNFTVTASNGRETKPGFHGQVYIDSATRSVRRVSLIADELPKNFPTHATRIDVDYDYVAISDRDYLVPVSAEMRLIQGRHSAVLNTMEFRNYRRFGSTMRMVNYTPLDPKPDQK
ncbi:VWA domain-containing protein [Occallatibacter riparius]|uniref:VWA domain-containing protein n=1 Tax=Occallatibacter riparius TaxID=1002689 RepID=A0A9J7BMJ8_9BACT|nr:VWA domain-containing protein [Occallatibacter riparius]UWZ83863.1 VWA domain-containing protein [Occallatibacter riparius]